MTREEAIKTWLPIILEGVKNMPKLEEALNMAIKALEQESTTKTCKTCRNYGSHHGVCDICHDCSCWTKPTERGDKE